MTGFIERIRAATRAFKTGAAVVGDFEMQYGHDAIYSPSEYGNYIAMSNAVYACATLRADMLASIPLRAYRLVGGKKQDVSQGAVVDLLAKVNPFWTMNRLIEMTELSLCLWGQAFWAVERGANGRSTPRELWWMKPDQVKVYPDAVNYVRGFEFKPTNGERAIWFEPYEVIWFRYPNPLDEFSGLSPLAAARLAADMSSAAQKTNMALFKQGYQAGGVIMPKGGGIWTANQAMELEKSLEQRFKGVDRAHRWGVMRQEVDIKAGAFVSPKDAEFLGALTWSLEEVARAYKVPLDMIGGQRTYENVQAAERAFWFRTMEPEARFIASEIVEQLLPMFGAAGGVDLAAFDLSRVPILQDAESERWSRAKEQIVIGAVTINEWRESEGLERVEWGDVYWAQMGLRPVQDASEMDEGMEVMGEADIEEIEGGENLRGKRGKVLRVKRGSEEHWRAWKRWERDTGRWEKTIGQRTAELFRQQEESLVANLPKLRGEWNAEGTRAVVDEAWFDLTRWTRLFRKVMRDLLKALVGEFGEAAIEALGRPDLIFNVGRPEVLRFIEMRAQRFAERVNETTWEMLRDSLSEGIENGEGLEALKERVREVMGDRIRSSEEVIARTEVNGAANGGSLEAWKQSGVDVKKAWLSALLPDRTRETHFEAHDRYNEFPIGLDEDFDVGGGSGPHPGAIGLAEEDINCLCSMVPVVMD